MADDADEQARQAQMRAGRMLGQRLAKIGRKAALQRSTGFRIPELDADPPADGPTSLWLLSDGRLRARTSDGVVRQYLTETAASSPVSAVTRPVQSSPRRYRGVYLADWGVNFCQVHGRENGRDLFYGRQSDAHGTRRIMLGFNDQAMRADLAGATIRQVQLHAVNVSARWDRGVEVYYGAHGQDAPPAQWSSVRRFAYHGLWPVIGSGEEWRTIPQWFGTQFQAGTIKGITVEQPNGAESYYGQMAWASFAIAIDYTK